MLATSDQDWEGEKINMMTMHAITRITWSLCIFLPGRHREMLFLPPKINRGKRIQRGLEEERQTITRAKKMPLYLFQ